MSVGHCGTPLIDSGTPLACLLPDPRTDPEPERSGGSTRPDTYLRCLRPKRSASPRFLPLRPGYSTLEQGRHLSKSVSQAFGQAGRWPTHRRQRGSQSSWARSAPARTARSPRWPHLLWAPDARMKYERVRRGADREALRASRVCHRARKAEIISERK